MRRSIIGAMVLAAAAAVATCGGSDTPTGPSNTGPLVFTAALSGTTKSRQSPAPKPMGGAPQR